MASLDFVFWLWAAKKSPGLACHKAEFRYLLRAELTNLGDVRLGVQG